MFIQEPPTPQQFVSEILSSPIRPASPVIGFDDVLILNRGDNTHVVPSGVYWVVIAIKGELSDGQTQYFYKTVFSGPGEPVPPISGRCRIEAHQTEWTGGMISGENDLSLDDDAFSRPSMWLIERFECSISSDSPIIPPAQIEWELGIGNPEPKYD